MDNRHEGCERSFTILSESWYRNTALPPGVLDEIMVGMYHHEGGTTGEFAIRWKDLGREPTPRLEVYGDAWNALQCFGDLLAWMSEADQHASPQQVVEALRRLGPCPAHRMTWAPIRALLDSKV